MTFTHRFSFGLVSLLTVYISQQNNLIFKMRLAELSRMFLYIFTIFNHINSYLLSFAPDSECVYQLTTMLPFEQFRLRHSDAMFYHHSNQFTVPYNVSPPRRKVTYQYPMNIHDKLSLICFTNFNQVLTIYLLTISSLKPLS